MYDLAEANQCALDLATQAIDRFPWSNPAAYAGWLGQTYHYAAWTVSLLSMMCARTNIKQEPELHRARMVHTSEELGHEQWLIGDLSALGYDVNAIPELAVTRMFWEPQFAKADLYGVEAIYGYTIILEQLSVLRGEFIDEQVRHLGNGKTCNKFISAHSVADIPHVKKDLELIQSLPVEHHRSIADNMYQTAQGYSLMLSNIKELAL